MKICDTRDHSEIVFEGRDCEACEMIKIMRDAIKELEGKISNLESEIEEIQRNG